MGQMYLPGLEPGYVRVELELVEHGLWSLVMTPAASRQFITTGGQQRYEGMSWSEALDVLADVLDCVVPACNEQGPF